MVCDRYTKALGVVLSLNNTCQHLRLIVLTEDYLTLTESLS